MKKIAQPTEGGARAEGALVVFWMRQGRKELKVEMDAQSAIGLANQLYAASRQARQVEARRD